MQWRGRYNSSYKPNHWCKGLGAGVPAEIRERNNRFNSRFSRMIRRRCMNRNHNLSNKCNRNRSKQNPQHRIISLTVNVHTTTLKNLIIRSLKHPQNLTNSTGKKNASYLLSVIRLRLWVAQKSVSTCSMQIFVGPSRFKISLKLIRVPKGREVKSSIDL